MSKPLPSVISEDELGYSTYERLRAESRRGATQGPSPYGPSTAQGWHKQRCWNGETRYVPRSGPSDDWVRHVYDPTDALKDD